MINILTALKYEANPIINYYKLNKDNNFSKFEIYKNDNINLIISKPGIINAAISSTLLNGLYIPSLSVNIGICASTDKSLPIGHLCYINKITNDNTNRSFYPDILANHNLFECSIRSYDSIISNNNLKAQPEKLIDMEAAGFIESALKFIQPNNIACIKIISDYTNPKNLSPSLIHDLINRNINKIDSTITKILKISKLHNEIVTKAELNQLYFLCEKLFFTEYMKNSIKNLYIYHKLGGKSPDSFISLLKLDLKSKKEGKIYFEKLKKIIIK